MNKALINAGRERLFIELKDIQADGMLIPEVIGGTIGTLKNASAVIGPDCRESSVSWSKAGRSTIEPGRRVGMFDCAAMLAVFVAGMTVQQLDRTRVYEIPASQMQRLSLTQRTFARACAVKHGIRYRVVNDSYRGLN